MSFYPLFWGRVPLRIEIDYQKKGTLVLTSLLEEVTIARIPVGMSMSHRSFDHTVNGCEIHVAPLRNHGTALFIGICRERNHSRGSWVVQDFVHPQQQSEAFLKASVEWRP